MKRIMIIALALCLGGMTLTSCQKEENKNSNEGNGSIFNPPTPPGTTHEAVDLGLSVKWATCNVGAGQPYEIGDYYAWGETATKSMYDWTNYKWSQGTWDSMTKYNTQAQFGTVDNKTALDPEDDVAHVKWGGNWRMPTLDEVKSLVHDCEWQATIYHNVKGYKVIGPNGNSIFLPGTGHHERGNFYPDSTAGYFWTKTLNSGNPYGAYMVSFVIDQGLYFPQEGVNSREMGLAVRPVCTK